MSYLFVPQLSAQSTQTTGFSLTIPNGITLYVINSALALLTGTITMPAIALDGQPLTIISPKGIAAVTVNANTGQSFSAAPFTAMVANTPYRLKFSGVNSTWYAN